MDLIVRLFLVLAAPITALFVHRDALNFSVIQMIVAIVLFVMLVAAVHSGRDVSHKIPSAKPPVSRETDQAAPTDAVLRASRRR